MCKNLLGNKKQNRLSQSTTKSKLVPTTSTTLTTSAHAEQQKNEDAHSHKNESSAKTTEQHHLQPNMPKTDQNSNKQPSLAANPPSSTRTSTAPEKSSTLGAQQDQNDSSHTHRMSHVLSSAHIAQNFRTSSIDAVSAAVQLKPKVKEVIAPIFAQKDHEIELLVKDVEILQREIEQLQGDYTELRDRYESMSAEKDAAVATKEKRIIQLERELQNMRMALEMAQDEASGHGPLYRPTTTNSSTTENESAANMHASAGQRAGTDDSAAAEVEQLGQSLMRRAVVNDGGTSWMTRTRAESVVKVEKDNKTRQFLLRALRQNGMLGRLENARLIEIVEYMERVEVEQGKEIDTAGKTGKFFYVIEEGEVEVYKAGKIPVGIIHSGHCFGEVTLFFRIKRQASVITKTPCKLWRLSRAAYNVIMTVFGQRRLLEVETFLRECPMFSTLDDRQLARLANGVQTEYYEKGETIITEGSTSDGFYIVDEGTVNMCQRAKSFAGPTEQKIVQTLETGAYFGEAAFTNKQHQTAPRSKYSMIAATDVRILTLEKSEFDRLLGHLEKELQMKDQNAANRESPRKAFIARYSLDVQERVREMSNVTLDVLQRIAPLGQGSFGTVFLVKHESTAFGEQYYALKAMSKAWVKKHNAMDHVLAEKKAWTAISGSPFLCQLYATLKDTRHLYYLMENLPGGDVYSHIMKQGHMSEDATRFYAGCMVLALEWMHARNIIFRDLKPENVALDEVGYGKLIDFGFAKDISKTFRTFTFCGSPFYMAPEVVASEGHDYGCDIWSLGVTLVEIQTGAVPFANVHNEHVLFKKIARGFDGFDLPRTLHHRLRDFVKALCQRRPADRLGYDENGVREIRNHKYFEGFDWTSLELRKKPPPFAPEVSSPADLRNARPPKEEKTSKEKESEEVNLWDFGF